MEEIIRLINTTCREIIAKVVCIEVDLQETSRQGNYHPSYDYSFIIGVTGFYKGSVSLSMKKETAFFIAAFMTGKDSIDELDTLTKSALKELVNMAVGQSMCRLADKGHIDISPPTLVKGTNLCVSSPAARNSFVTTLTFSKGAIELNISLVEAANKKVIFPSSLPKKP